MPSSVDLFESFWTYQTPVSFFAGIGVYHLYCRVRHMGVYDESKDEKDDVQEE